MRVLNVGGNDRSISIPEYYAGWEHLILDIDPAVNPDICADARELTKLEVGSFDAIYCSHNLEHYYPHDVPRVLAGFLHVLKPTGFAEIRVPDLGALMRLVVEKNMDVEDVVYDSHAGPVHVLDMLYGYGPEIARSGHDYFAHKVGFTQKSLTKVLHLAGFRSVAAGATHFMELGALAFPFAPTDEQRKLFGLAT